MPRTNQPEYPRVKVFLVVCKTIRPSSLYTSNDAMGLLDSRVICCPIFAGFGYTFRWCSSLISGTSIVKQASAVTYCRMFQLTSQGFIYPSPEFHEAIMVIQGWSVTM